MATLPTPLFLSIVDAVVSSTQLRLVIFLEKCSNFTNSSYQKITLDNFIRLIMMTLKDRELAAVYNSHSFDVCLYTNGRSILRRLPLN